MGSSLETLESRVLLSVSLEAGQLRIGGTAGDDQIKLSHPLLVPGQLRPYITRTLVEVNGEQYSFKTKNIKVIKINALEGNDRIKIGPEPTFSCALCRMPVKLDLMAFYPAIPTLLVGGPGADSIIGGNGRDRIYGGDGDDTLYGGSGNDLLDGGEGDDALSGFVGNDMLVGAAGNDVLDGIEGNDQLFAGSGKDTLYANSAADFLSGGEGEDLLKYPVYAWNIDGSIVPPAFKVPADIELKEPYLDVAIL
jgi:Ca2+-binding RTX toxin-like protein